MEKKEKSKIIQAALKFILDAEDKGLIVHVYYFSSTQGLSITARLSEDKDYVIWEHIWLGDITFQQAERKLVQIIKEAEKYYENAL